MPHFTHLMAMDILIPMVHPFSPNVPFWGKEEDKDNPLLWVSFCPKFPHLFRPLKWWEGLAIDEFPKYLKRKRDGIVIRVKYENGKNGIKVRNSEYPKFVYDLKDYLQSCEPATEAEYNEYLTNLNSK
jgi:hypothetical protein